MRVTRIQQRLLITCTLAALSACHTSSQRPTRTATAPPTAAGPTPAKYDPRMAESDRKAKEMGYRIVMRDGAQFYCRTVAPMGSRIPQKECLRADAMDLLIRRTEEDKANIRQFQYCGPACVPPVNAQ